LSSSAVTIDAGSVSSFVSTISSARSSRCASARPICRSSGGIAPFAKLSWNEKARVFRDFETQNPKIVVLVRRSGVLDGWLVDALDGLIKYLAMAMLALSADGHYSEQSKFDWRSKRFEGRPVSWDQCGYLADTRVPPDGHPEFLGYYQDRKAVEA